MKSLSATVCQHSLLKLTGLLANRKISEILTKIQQAVVSVHSPNETIKNTEITFFQEKR